MSFKYRYKTLHLKCMKMEMHTKMYLDTRYLIGNKFLSKSNIPLQFSCSVRLSVTAAARMCCH